MKLLVLQGKLTEMSNPPPPPHPPSEPGSPGQEACLLLSAPFRGLLTVASLFTLRDKIGIRPDGGVSRVSSFRASDL